MQLPKYHETLFPILQVIKDGNAIHYNELRKLVRDSFYSDLPQELLEKKTKSGDPIILNRIGWGKAYLKMGKFVEYPERAMVRITSKGKAVLEKGSFTLKDLMNDPDFQKHREIQSRLKAGDTVEEDDSSPQDRVESGVQQVEGQVKEELLEKLRAIDPYYFEKVILLLLQKMGYGDFVETAKSGDGGIDGIINEDQLGLAKIYVQAKRYNENKVREKDIRNFIGAMSGDTSKGVFVTTSEFDEHAMKKAREAHHVIILVDGERLVDLMYKFGVGVQIKTSYELKEIDNDFFEEG